MKCINDISDLRIGLSLASSSLSFILSLLVIFIILKKSLFKTYSFRILLYISINDLVRSIIGILETLSHDNSALCAIYGYINMHLFVSNTIWALCLTFTIFQIIVLEQTSFERWHKHWVFISVVCLGGLYALPFITSSFGYNQGFCQIINDPTGNIWRFSIVYFPSIIMFIAIIVLYYKIFKKLKILGNISYKSIILDRGLIYALIISVILIPFFVVRVIQISQNNCEVEIAIILVNSFYFLEGFFNGIVFFYNKTVRGVLFAPNEKFKTYLGTTFHSLNITFASDI